MPIIKLTMTDAEMQHVLTWARGVPVASLAKHALLERSRYQEGTARVPGGYSPPKVPQGYQEGTAGTCDDSGTETALSSTPEKNKSNTDKKEKKAPRLAPLDVSERIIGHLNKLAGTKMRPDAEGHRVHIQRRLSKGNTEEQMCEVIRKQVADWKGTDYARHLVPETLFGGKFDKYLDRPEPSGGKKPYTIKASDVGRSDVAPGDLFKHAEVDDR